MIQLFISVVVVIIVFGFVADDRYNPNGFNKWTFQHRAHQDQRVRGIFTCADLESSRCTTPLAVVHDPEDAVAATRVQAVLDRLLASNPQIAPAEIARYSTSSQLNAALLAAPLSVAQALHFPPNFGFVPPALPKFTMQVNQSQFCVFGYKSCMAAWKDIELPLQVSVERAMLQAATGSSALSLEVAVSRFPNPRLDEYAREIARFLGPNLIMLGCIANFVIMLNQLVQEKERKLKLLLRISGVSDTAMWLSWWVVILMLT